MDNKKLLGKRIKELRKAKGYTQEQLAELIDIETCSLSSIEIGRHYPSMPTIVKIAENLGVELHKLFEFSHIKSRDEKISIVSSALNNLSDKDLDFLYKYIDFYSK